jgi:hypothetical protein
MKTFCVQFSIIGRSAIRATSRKEAMQKFEKMKTPKIRVRGLEKTDEIYDVVANKAAPMDPHSRYSGFDEKNQRWFTDDEIMEGIQRPPDRLISACIVIPFRHQTPTAL